VVRPMDIEGYNSAKYRDGCARIGFEFYVQANEGGKANQKPASTHVQNDLSDHAAFFLCEPRFATGDS